MPDSDFFKEVSKKLKKTEPRDTSPVETLSGWYKRRLEYLSLDCLDLEAIQMNSVRRTIRNPELIESIREEGVLDPIDVLELEDGFKLIHGTSRVQACIELGIKEIPCWIYK